MYHAFGVSSTHYLFNNSTSKKDLTIIKDILIYNYKIFTFAA